MQIKFCFIDTETTGLDKIKNGIIQIAGKIIFNNDGVFELKEVFNFRVKPCPNDIVEPGALKVNGTTMEEIYSYDPPLTVYREFIQMLSKYCDKYNKTDKYFFIGYNAIFDFGMMWEWFRKCDDPYFGSWFFTPPIDVMTIAALNLMPVRHTLPNFKLETIANYYQVKAEGDLHDAMVDIDVTEKVFYKLMAEPINSLQAYDVTVYACPKGSINFPAIRDNEHDYMLSLEEDSAVKSFKKMESGDTVYQVYPVGAKLYLGEKCAPFPVEIE